MKLWFLFTEAILNTLSQRLASSSSQHVQEAVLAHLLQWRDRTFQAAKLNLRVNGQNFEDYLEEEDETEPFDEALDRRIWSLSVEKMQWDKELAERRREVPIQIESLLEDMLAQAGTEAEDPSYSEEQDSTIMDEARLPREAEVLDLCKRVMGVHEDVQKKASSLREKHNREITITEDIKNLPS